jgi:uncharacterized protein (DUF3084 family)
MKPKTILWSCLVLTLIAIGVLALAGRDRQGVELAAQHEKELEAMRLELEQAKASAGALESELNRLRKDNQELLRLRGEVRQLRDDKQALASQAQSAQAAAQRAQAQAIELAEATKQRMAALDRQAEYEARIKATVDASGGLTSPEGQAAADCINNLRQVDGAKQQWALENKMSTNAIPNPKDLLPYFRDNALPACPSGGAYTFNAVSLVPACSIPGHVLPQ